VATVLVLAVPAFAQITVTVVTPQPGALQADHLGVFAEIASVAPVAGVVASVADRSSILSLSVNNHGTQAGGSLDLAGLPHGPLTLTVTATDVNGLVGQAATELRHDTPLQAYVESSPSLVLVGTYAGLLLDLDPTYALIIVDGILRTRAGRVERASGSTDVVYMGSRPLSRATLTTNGFIWLTIHFSDARPRVRAYRPSHTGVWPDDPLHEDTLRVAGRWATWYYRDPIYPLSGTSLTRYDVELGSFRTITASVLQGADVSIDGDVAYQDCSVIGGCGIHLFDEQTSSVVFLGSGQSPRLDGELVVARDGRAIVALTRHGRVLLAEAGPDAVAPDRDYQVAGGWIAFTRSTGGGARQVWRRTPDGVESLVAAPANDAPLAIERVSATGEMMLLSARRRYLSRPGHALLEIGLPGGRAVFVDGRWYVLLGPHLLEVVPRTSLLLAEGSPGPFFDTELALLNPTVLPIDVRLHYLLADGSRVERTHTLAPATSTVLRADDEPGLAGRPFAVALDASDGPLVLERQMTWGADGQGGHASAAAAGPRLTWTFAEGAQGFFDTFFLLTNAADRTAEVELTFLLEHRPPVTHRVRVRPQARLTLWAGDVPALADRAFATIVEASVPIVAERSMYFGPGRHGGHTSGGIPERASTWWFAEGATGGPFTTFLLFANPQARPVEASLQFVTAAGTVVSVPLVLPARSRRTINVAELAPALAQTVFATRVTTAATDPIAVERAMYWAFDGGPCTSRRARRSRISCARSGSAPTPASTCPASSPVGCRPTSSRPSCWRTACWRRARRRTSSPATCCRWRSARA
jgi:hypothetical protein